MSKVFVDGPMYRPRCDACLWIGVLASSKTSAEEWADEHDCLIQEGGSIVLNHDGTEDGYEFATHRPTLRQFVLVPAEEWEPGEVWQDE